MELARLGGILPAFLLVEESSRRSFEGRSNVAAYADANELIISAQAKLPVAANEAGPHLRLSQRC